MTDFIDQQPFVMAEFADNPEPRCPCVLLLDTSASMAGVPIQQLNEGIRLFREELLSDSLASKRVELAIVTFGPVNVVRDFSSPDLFVPPEFEASSDTPMGSAIVTGLDLLSARKEILRSNGIKLFRPWVFLITDGAPTDHWQNVPQMITAGEERGSFSFFAVGVSGADMNTLGQISTKRAAVPLQGLKFREFFTWLSASLKSVSHSQPGDTVKLLAPHGWAEV